MLENERKGVGKYHSTLGYYDSIRQGRLNDKILAEIKRNRNDSMGDLGNEYPSIIIPEIFDQHIWQPSTKSPS